MMNRPAARSILPAFTLLAVLPLPASPPAGEEPGAAGVAVRFVEPEAPFLSGRERIVVEVDLPEGDRIDRLDLFVDGELAGRARRPPYRFEHDFGPNVRPHVLLALAFTRGGATGRAEFRSRAAPILGRVDVKLVQLTVTVLDAAGNLVRDLERGDFRVFENGVEQEIAFFEHGESPASIALTLDCSRSMESRLWRAQKAANDFVRALPDHYQVSILGFNDEVWLARDFTGEKRSLVYTINQLEAEGETALFDAIRASSLHLRGRPERRAVVLFTDGQESVTEGGKEREAKLEAVLEAANRSEVTFFAIGYGGDPAVEVLSRIAADTGGAFYPADGRLDLGRLYGEISATLGSQYTVAYYPSPAPPPREWREVEVRVRPEGMRVRHRRGYVSSRR